MTKWYKYSLKEYGITSKPIFLKKESLKRRKKAVTLMIKKTRLVLSSFFVLWFSPNCGLFTCLKIICSQALAYSKYKAAYSQGFGEKWYCSSSARFTNAKGL